MTIFETVPTLSVVIIATEIGFGKGALLFQHCQIAINQQTRAITRKRVNSNWNSTEIVSLNQFQHCQIAIIQQRRAIVIEMKVKLSVLISFNIAKSS